MIAPVLLASMLASNTPDSQHARELAAHREEAPAILRRPLYAAGDAPRPTRVVYGYYPYWVAELGRVRWALLTHIAYFAIELASDGTPTASHGWPNAAFVETAHSNGVKVDITFTLFDGDGIATLCGSAANRARAIDTMITAMEEGGADGVNVDFEGVEAATRADFTTFIAELRAELGSRGHPNAGIGIAGPAVDYGDAFDLGALAELIDVYFIMGYGYHWGRSTRPGPVGQLRITESWRPHMSISFERTLAHYTSLVSAEKRATIVLGVPYYGYDWPADSGAIHATATGSGSSKTYAVARRAIASGRTRLYDADSENPWYAYRDATTGGWRQTWYDDEESLAAKYQLVLEQEIGGIGIWALGYDEDYPELWSLIDSQFTAEPEHAFGTRQNPKLLTEFPFSEANDTRLAPSNYFNTYSCAPATPEHGREWVYAFRICGSGRFEANVTDGTGVDVDLHLLRGPTEAECVARNDAAIAESLMPGTYFLVADTYVANQVAQAGEFQLDVSFTLDDPSAECPPDPPPPIDPPPLEPVPPTDQPVEVLGAGPPPRSPEVPIAGGEVTPNDDAGCTCGSTRSDGIDWTLIFGIGSGMMITACGRRRSRS